MGQDEYGVWVVLYRDHYEHIDTVWLTEVEALRQAVKLGFGRVEFLKFGESVTDLNIRLGVS